MPEILRVLGNVVRIKTEPLGDAVERRRARITDAESGYFGLQEAMGTLLNKVYEEGVHWGAIA